MSPSGTLVCIHSFLNIAEGKCHSIQRTNQHSSETLENTILKAAEIRTFSYTNNCDPALAR